MNGANAAAETRRSTVRRVLDASPKRVSEAFLDPDELAQWLHPPGASCGINQGGEAALGNLAALLEAR